MSFESLQDMLAWNPPPVPQYVGNYILLKKTKMCVFGGPKMFKSIMAAQLGFCIASGSPWMGIPTKQGKVAYMQCEIPKGPFRDRTAKMAKNMPNVPMGAFVFNTDFSFKLDRNSDVTTLENYLSKARPDVLILDPWYKMLSVEDNQAYSRTQDIMDYLIDKYDLSIIMVHHDTVPMNDPQTGQPINRFHPRGPRTVEGWFDTIMQIDGNIQNDDRILRFEMRHAITLARPIQANMDRNKLWLEPKP